MPFKTVSEILGEIKYTLEGHFRGLSIEGEVTNFSSSASGHYYFSLTDGQNSISCALFRMNAMRNPLIKSIKNGDKIICHGDIGVYSKRGTFQLIAKNIEKVGRGSLQEQYEKLKSKLAGDGLFDIENKMTIPTAPKRVGLVTGKDSAAYYDFINVMERRSLWMDILYTPALVQGEGSPSSLRSSLERLIKYHLAANDESKLDVIVLTRGGGSLEDLWSFNDEGLAWDIYNCPIPIISAVGHDVDFSICDYVADKRCETPTAAAELLSRRQGYLKADYDKMLRRLATSGRMIVDKSQSKLSLYDLKRQKLLLASFCHNKKLQLDKLDIGSRFTELVNYHEKQADLEDLRTRLKSYTYRYKEIAAKIDRQEHVLNALNPKNVLERGYAYVQDEDGKTVEKVASFDRVDDEKFLKIVFQDGERTIKKYGDVVK